MSKIPFLVFFAFTAAAMPVAGMSREQYAREGGTEAVVKIIHRGKEFTIKNIEQERDLRRYARGGFYFCDYRARPEAHCDLAEARQFVWKHWSAKQRGYIRISFGGIDYFSTDHIFIEPDERGRWCIRSRVVGSSALPVSGRDTIRDMPKVTRVERIKRRRTDPPGGDYTLVFTTATGHQLNGL